MPRIIFAQRFALSFKMRDRTAITNGTQKYIIAITSNSSGVACMPTISPALISSITPGTIKYNIVLADIVTATNSHKTANLIFKAKSSRIYHLLIVERLTKTGVQSKNCFNTCD